MEWRPTRSPEVERLIRFTEEEFRKLVKYMSEQFGIDLSKKKILAECRLNGELEKRGGITMSEFLRQMEADKTRQLESILLNRLTTNYTYFMREPKHFNFLKENILPAIKPEWGRISYQIWCAGCSSGEECYTLAMLLQDYKDQGGFLPPYSILGTDISEQALSAAESGRYPVRELENIPESWRKKYLVGGENDEFFEITAAIRSKVRFRRMNLLKPSAGLGEYDLVLCRNVMIYFHEESRKKLIEKLYRALKPGGYLFVGHTELLPRNHELFDYVCPAVYRK